MQEEIALRARTAKKYGVNDPAPIHVPAHPKDVNILVLQNPSVVGYDLAHAFPNDYRIEQVPDTASAFEMLGRRDFDAVVVDIRAPDQLLLYFCVDLRENSRFYNISVMIVADEKALINLDAAFESGATDILTRPFSPDHRLGNDGWKRDRRRTYQARS